MNAGPPREARRGGPWVRPFVVAYLVIQVGVPLVQLGADRPARFGWQMYSAVHPVDVVVVDHGGRRRTLDAELVDLVRSDLDPLVAIAPELCANPVVARVLTVDRSTGEEKGISCP
jgi:hypothetical protein